MRLAAGLLPLALLAASPAPAGAGNFPTRQGEAGLLDVPSAELIEKSTAMIGFELGWDHAPGTPDRFGPLPFSLGVGLGRLELGFSARESGFPGDPRPAPMLFGAALKVSVLPPAGWRPGLAVDGYLDRFNDDGAGGGRLVLSTGQVGVLKLAGYAGYETQASGPSGLAAGLAVQVRHQSGLEAVLEGVLNPRGNLVSAAVRWDVSPRVGLSLGASYLPDEQGVRIALGFGFHGVPLRRGAVAAPPPAAAAAEVPEEAAPSLALGDRPMFKLKLHLADPSRLGEPRHLQHGPTTPPARAGTLLAPPPRVVAPSADEVLGAQLRDQELQAEARLKRLRSTDASLDADEANLDADARKLDERERVLAAREAQLAARERRIVVRGAPTEAARRLESQEAQLGAAERQLAAQERGFSPTLEAALGTERDAQAREQGERREADRLLAQADGEKTKARQGELRRQALAARQRMLAAMESRLVARGERIDAASRALRTRGERLDTWQRRLDVRAERLSLLEQRAAEQQRGAAAPAPGIPPPPVPGDRAVFVMVVKSPTAIMRAGGEKTGPAEGQREALHPGVAVEKAVAAATVVTFSSPTARLSELDRETIEGIARLAARENCEVLVWARAKDPSLMTEANRRAGELKALVISMGNLPPQQVVTRITTRPGSLGVDVVISALREGGKAGAEVAPGAAPGDKLAGGETAKRQIRDAVVAVQPVIERCVSQQMVRRGLLRAEGSLKLTVSPAGRIVAATTAGGDLGGGDLEACLKAGSAGWQFPPADTEYVVDVPITVVSGGVKP